MTEYKGLNIPEKIIIVRSNTANSDGYYQGYVVDADNEEALQHAKYWAQGYYVKGIDVQPEPMIYTYENGHFQVQLYDAAEDSWGQGKLSFWNCIITAPDEMQFKIGINSELLLDLMLNNDMKQGKLSGYAYFGKQKGNTGLFTENMSSFEQAKKDKEQRAQVKKRTIQYSIGDVVGSLKYKYIYMGEHKLRIKWYYNCWEKHFYITVLKEPLNRHVYIENFTNEFNGNDFTYKLSDKKTSYTIFHHLPYLPDLSCGYKAHLERNINRLKESPKDLWWSNYTLDYFLRRMQLSTLPETDLVKAINEFAEKYTPDHIITIERG